MPKITNTLTKELNLSIDPVNQTNDSYSYALNLVKENIINDPHVIANEKGFSEYLDLGYEYLLLGSRYLGKKDYVIFIMNKEGDTPFNRILLISDNNVSIIRDNLDLTFNSSNPIMSTYRLNYKNQRIVYWVDGLNEDRVLNIDIDTTSYNISLLSINSSASKPIIEATVLDTGGSMLSGQYFIAISYNLGDSFTTQPLIISKPISIAAEDYYNNVTITDAITRQFGQTDGDVLGIPTRKSLSINITEIDSNFDSYNIIVVRQTENANIVRVIKNISPSQSTYLYSGLEGAIDDTITLNDIITDSINYYASEAIIQKDNRLLRGNSKLKAGRFNYQQYANNIHVKYKINEELVYDADVQNGYRTSSESDGGYIDVSNAVTSHSISPSYLANTANNDVDNKTFMRDEVYSLGVGFELIDGTTTDVFHIPGRLPNLFTTTPTGTGEYDRTYTSNWDTDTVNGQPRWMTRNTAIKSTLGELSYWRSSEVYPSGYGFPTNGEKDGSDNSYIRHHKMPSDVLEPIYTTVITGDPNRDKGEYTRYRMYKRNLGLDFSNIVIPSELKSQISKINFYMTPRDSSNKSILSKGLMYKLEKNGNDEFEQSHTFNSDMADIDSVSDFEFISPEVNFNFKESSLSGSKIKVCGIDKGYVNYAGDKQSIDLGGPYYIRSFNNQLHAETNRRQSIVSAFCFYNQRAIPKEDIYSRDLNKLIFVDANYVGTSDVGPIRFTGSQNSSVLQLLTPLTLKPTPISSIQTYYPELLYPTNVSTRVFNNINLIYPIDLVNDRTWNGYGNCVDWLEERSWSTAIYYDTSYYVSIVLNKSNLYGTINNLIYTNVGSSVKYNGSDDIISATVNGGDTFIDIHHFRRNKVKLVSRDTSDPVLVPITLDTQFGVYDDNNSGKIGNLITEVNELGNQSFGSFFCETDLNIRMRREGNNDDEKYFPKSYYTSSKIANFNKWIINSEFYKIELPYNTSYIKPYFVSYVDIDTLTSDIDDIRYYTRIIYSDKQNLEDKTDNYRKIRANNYRDLPLDKGEIAIFFVNKEKLFCITRDTVFNVFTSNQNIQTVNETNVSVGTGEFLGTEPIDLMSIDGGFAGTSSKLSFVESPFGYLFVDRHKGKIVLFGDSMDDISIRNINKFFKTNHTIEALQEFNIKDLNFDLPLNNFGYTCGYDADLNRYLITKLDYILTDEAQEKYKGEFSESYPYEEGDIYIKDNVLYIFETSTVENVLLIDTSNLSDFVQSDISPININTTSPTNGSIVNNNDGAITYTPNLDYDGLDTFTVSSNCRTEDIEVNISILNYNFKWIASDPYCEQE